MFKNRAAAVCAVWLIVGAAGIGLAVAGVGEAARRAGTVTDPSSTTPGIDRAPKFTRSEAPLFADRGDTDAVSSMVKTIPVSSRQSVNESSWDVTSLWIGFDAAETIERLMPTPAAFVLMTLGVAMLRRR